MKNTSNTWEISSKALVDAMRGTYDLIDNSISMEGFQSGINALIKSSLDEAMDKKIDIKEHPLYRILKSRMEGL